MATTHEKPRTTPLNAKRIADPPKDVEDDVAVNAALHRRVLNFLNDAVSPDDLMFEKVVIVHAEGAAGPLMNPGHNGNGNGNGEGMGGRGLKVMTEDAATRLLEFRNREFPLGLRSIRELQPLKFIDREWLHHLLSCFSDRLYGRWETFPVPIPRRGNGTMDGIVHASLCHTGKVLFITADETSLLWDPNNPTPATFEDPANQPQNLPDGYSQLCGHQVFLPDGQLLCVGGGGYGPNAAAHFGWRFNPDTKAWARSANSMSEAKWYPTATVLNDDKVLVTSGNNANLADMDIYDIATDSFTAVTGDTKPFPNLYPGLHVLPNGILIYSRTGWGSAGAGGFAQADNQSAFFTFTGPTTGVWNPIVTATENRAKGMSVALHATTPPYLRIMVIGGVDNATNNTYQFLDATVLSPLTAWSTSTAFPDGEHRSLCSAVLLPDGNVFVAGGIQRINSPCAMFKPATDTWAPMSELPSIRDYHSAAILLPSGQVMMAGWQNPNIEIYSPPYLFGSARPIITSVPTQIHHGQTFTIDSPNAADIAKVVLVRPMAITHQTDSEQRVLELPVTRDAAHPTRLTLMAPHGGNVQSTAPRGYYMVFAVKSDGVPSRGQFTQLT
jgi:hypothetical protein